MGDFRRSKKDPHYHQFFMVGRELETVEVGIVESCDKTRQYMQAIIGGTPGILTRWACSTGQKGLASMRQRPPTVVLVSLLLQDMTGTDFIVRARQNRLDTSFLLLLPDNHPNLFVQALEAGASGYLPKLCGAHEMVEAIWTVHKGGAVISDFLAKPLVEYFRARGSVLNKLTEREREVLTCLSQGLSAAHIAINLGIDPATVRTHVRNVLSKFDAHSTAEVIALYLNPKMSTVCKNGLLPKDKVDTATQRMTRKVPPQFHPIVLISRSPNASMPRAVAKL